MRFGSAIWLSDFGLFDHTMAQVNTQESGNIFTTHHFLHNLRMSPISWIITFIRLERLACDTHYSLLDPLAKGKRKLSVVNMAPDSVF